ncbi:4a-hydroxytetrahydrobiopterin dehydratase [bacterium]|nr:MAG: 4a-hydroxytetrahydrobiopterin dehydratase [bacterium]
MAGSTRERGRLALGFRALGEELRPRRLLPYTQPVLLSDSDIDAALADLPKWRREGAEIATEREFPTYKDGLVFATAVGWFADAADHHPDLKIGYQKVEIRLSSHDAGGITKRDVNLARKIDGL